MIIKLLLILDRKTLHVLELFLVTNAAIRDWVACLSLLLEFRQEKWIKRDVVDSQDVGNRGIHKSKGLQVEWWVLVSTSVRNNLGRLFRTILSHLIKLGQIISLVLDLILLKIQEKFLCGLASSVFVEGIEVLDTIIYKFIDLE